MNCLQKKGKVLAVSVTAISVVACWCLAFWALGVNERNAEEIVFEAPQWMLFFGRFHPVVLHLPIGLMTLSVLMEISRLLPKCWGIPRGDAQPINFLVVVSSSVAVVHGLFLFASGGYEGSELAERHLWGACAFLTSMGLVFNLRAYLAVLNQPVFALLGVAFSFVIMSISSHDGGALTHGEDYLTQYAPTFGKSEEADIEPVPAGILDQNVYDVAIQPVFDATCVSCHKESKAKGKLRMDTFEEFVKGGREGESFVPFKPEISIFLERIHYELDDEEHMPPEGKPQPTADQVKVLEWWVSVGAPNEGLLKDYNPSEDVVKTVEAY